VKETQNSRGRGLLGREEKHQWSDLRSYLRKSYSQSIQKCRYGGVEVRVLARNRLCLDFLRSGLGGAFLG
jgi:hypothetical protein